MSKQRFKVIKNFQPITFVEMANGKHYDCEEVVGLLNEQQATIRKLQDLCGESDGENAKLWIENNKLKEENEQLRNIIKQKEEEEKLYAKEILRLNELNKQTSEFTDILGGY